MRPGGIQEDDGIAIEGIGGFADQSTGGSAGKFDGGIVAIDKGSLNLEQRPKDGTNQRSGWLCESAADFAGR